MQVTVETLAKGFMINVFSTKNCQGMLVSILEAIEEMRLTVLEARVSCTDNFEFQAVGGEVRYILPSCSEQIIITLFLLISFNMQIIVLSLSFTYQYMSHVLSLYENVPHWGTR